MLKPTHLLNSWCCCDLVSQGAKQARSATFPRPGAEPRLSWWSGWGGPSISHGGKWIRPRNPAQLPYPSNSPSTYINLLIHPYHIYIYIYISILIHFSPRMKNPDTQHHVREEHSSSMIVSDCQVKQVQTNHLRFESLIRKNDKLPIRAQAVEWLIFKLRTSDWNVKQSEILNEISATARYCCCWSSRPFLCDLCALRLGLRHMYPWRIGILGFSFLWKNMKNYEIDNVEKIWLFICLWKSMKIIWTKYENNMKIDKHMKILKKNICVSYFSCILRKLVFSFHISGIHQIHIFSENKLFFDPWQAPG